MPIGLYILASGVAIDSCFEVEKVRYVTWRFLFSFFFVMEGDRGWLSEAMSGVAQSLS